MCNPELYSRRFCILSMDPAPASIHPMAQRLPTEILAHIAYESVDIKEASWEAWLHVRHVCRLFKRQVERAVVRRVLPTTYFWYDLGLRHVNGVGEITLSKTFRFVRLDPERPHMAIFRDEAGPPKMEAGHIDRREETQRKAMIGKITWAWLGLVPMRNKRVGAKVQEDCMTIVAGEPSDLPLVDLTFHIPKRTKPKVVTARFDWVTTMTIFMIDMRAFQLGMNGPVRMHFASLKLQGITNPFGRSR